MNSLYGASVSAGVRKFADSHALVFNIKAVCDCYLPEKISTQVAELLISLITEPNVREGAFDAEVVELERVNLKKQIKAYVNDKSAYADKRCIEIMCEGDNYATDVNGSPEMLDTITPESLYEHYVDILKNSELDVFLCGNVDVENIKSAFEVLSSNGKVPLPSAFKKEYELKEVEENMEVTQGKLVMGFRSDFSENSDRCRMMVFNGLFGGTATSKLFNNVREKLSLAYYANTRLNLSKGIIIARSGIEFSKYQAVREEIMKQLGEIGKGNISEEEMQNTKAHLINVYSSLEDDPESTVALKSGWIAEGETRNVSDIIEGIKNVTKDEVIECARSLKLCTVYFLKGEQQI